MDWMNQLHCAVEEQFQQFKAHETTRRRIINGYILDEATREIVAIENIGIVYRNSQTFETMVAAFLREECEAGLIERFCKFHERTAQLELVTIIGE